MCMGLGWGGEGKARPRPETTVKSLFSICQEDQELSHGPQEAVSQALNPSQGFLTHVPIICRSLLSNPVTSRTPGTASSNGLCSCSLYKNPFSEAHYTCASFHTDLKCGNHIRTIFHPSKFIIRRDLRAKNFEPKA